MLLTLDRIGPGRYALYVIGVVTAIFLLLPIPRRTGSER
jgi:hypothetical protein